MKRSSFKEVYPSGTLKEIWYYDNSQNMNKASFR